MLVNHRRALIWTAVLLSALVFVLASVGRHPPWMAPRTTLPIVGRWDLSVYRGVDDIRNGVLTAIASFLNVAGGGVVTIPLRVIVAAWLAFRARWRALLVWILTWAFAEVILANAKTYFHRGRPPGSLVHTIGFSFPSGHAVAATATAVALVLVFLAPGASRRRWEVAAVAFAFVMAMSRVYLRAHWLSDVVAGVLLGAAVSLGTAALVTEIRDVFLRRRERMASRAG